MSITPGDAVSRGSDGTDVNSANAVVDVDGGTASLPISLSSLQDAAFDRAGDDLVLRTGDDDVVVREYFDAGGTPDLTTDDGFQLAFDTVSRLAGPVTPAQYAQAGPAPAAAAAPIGEVEDLKGTVQATHIDGVSVELQEGDPVFQGDVLETAADGSIGIRFADGTTLGLDGDARMVLDEMVYNPGGDSGSMVFSLIKGAMVFVSGEIAATGPDAMMVKTPAATIGIRGTKDGVVVDATGQVFIDLFTWYSVVAAWNERGEWQIDGENPILAFPGGGGTPYVPLNAAAIHAMLFGAEQTLPPQPGDPFDESLEGIWGRLALFKSFLIDFLGEDFGGAFGPQLSTQGPLGKTFLKGPLAGTVLSDVDPFTEPDDPDPPLVNDPPEATDDAYGVIENTTLTPTTGVLANDTDLDGDAITVSSFSASSAEGGSVSVASDGAFTYTPSADFNGTDSFTYTITDSGGLTDSATVTITVDAVNDPPVANDDNYVVSEDTTLTPTTGVLANDTDLDGDAITVSSFSASSAAGGSVSVASDGAFTYTPSADFNGTDSFTYTITDGGGLTDSATVTVTVDAVNDPPAANAQSDA